VSTPRRRHGAGDVALAGSAFVLLGVMEGALRVVPFRRLMPILGMQVQRPTTPGPSEASNSRPVELDDDPAGWGPLQKVSWGIDAATRRTPWPSRCLSQALTGSVLLRAARRPATVYFAVRPRGASADGTMTAHAWLVSDDRILTGAAGREQYAVVGIYSTTSGITAG